MRKIQQIQPPSPPIARIAAWRAPLMLPLLVITGIVGLMPPQVRASGGAEQNMAQITDTRELLSNWVAARRDIAVQRKNWAEGKEFLNNRIQLVQQEIVSLRDKIADLKKNITDTDIKRDDLLKENQKLGQASQSLKQVIASLETRTQLLLAQMPAHVKDKVQLFSRQLPDDPAASDQSASKRIQPVLGILSTLNKFSRDINVASEIRDLSDGRSAEVAVMYLGLSRAYYVSANGQIAGTGRSDGKAWTWTPDNMIAPQVAQSIAIFKNEQPASFVRLPVATK